MGLFKGKQELANMDLYLLNTDQGPTKAIVHIHWFTICCFESFTGIKLWFTGGAEGATATFQMCLVHPVHLLTGEGHQLSHLPQHITLHLTAFAVHWSDNQILVKWLSLITENTRLNCGYNYILGSSGLLKYRLLLLYFFTIWPDIYKLFICTACFAFYFDFWFPDLYSTSCMFSAWAHCSNSSIWGPLCQNTALAHEKILSEVQYEK